MSKVFLLKAFRYLITTLQNTRWGGQALISLYLSIFSGIILGLQYDIADPFYSTATIELIAPFGTFWRALHYYSSQFFLLFLLAHTASVLSKTVDIHSRFEWIRLCSSIPITILLLFTGYVLRADATGESAGIIAENICLSIPVIGGLINDLFFDIDDSGLKKVLLHHFSGLVALGSFTIWQHLRRYPVRWHSHPLVLACTLIISILFAAPMEPEKIGLLHIDGPWFFLGLQELLRYLSTFTAGVVIPLIPILVLYFLPTEPQKRDGSFFFLLCWLSLYAIMTTLAYMRS